MFKVSPGMWTFTSVRAMLRLSALMRHSVSVVVVSTAAVSLRAMSRLESVSRAPFTSAVPWSRSMPSERSHSSPICPLTRRSLMKPLVLSLASLTDSSLMTTRFLKSGRNCTSTDRWPTSASVSPSWMARKLSIPKSRGHSSLTVPTVMSMPVFSDAMAATLSAAQF